MYGPWTSTRVPVFFFWVGINTNTEYSIQLNLLHKLYGLLRVDGIDDYGHDLLEPCTYYFLRHYGPDLDILLIFIESGVLGLSAKML